MNETEKRTYLLAKEQPSKALLCLGVPTMIGMLVSALYNIVDSYFVGLLGTAQMGAVSILFQLSAAMVGIGMLFGAGAGTYLARLLGSGQHKEASQCASTSIASGLITGIILVIAMLLFLDPLLRVLGATDSILPYARQYGFLFILGLIFNVFNITVNNIFTSEGASKNSMIAMLIGGFVNIGLDPFFIFTLHMGIQGAAIATLISRIISTSMYLYFILSGKTILQYSFHNI